MKSLTCAYPSYGHESSADILNGFAIMRRTDESNVVASLNEILRYHSNGHQVAIERRAAHEHKGLCA
jgi:hypothetical protein